ncbi:MAG TPA: serine hydrolase domain-containing protein [Thermoanaerobaculia bacterium]
MLEEYDGHVPGAALLAIRDGRVVLRHCAGMADLEHAIPVTPSTNFRLASMTKQFIARAIEILGVPPDRPVFREITVRQLLSHTSGLLDYELLRSAGVPPAVAGRPARRPQLTDHDVLQLLENTDRAYFPPGTQYRYSNGGYVLLGLLIERESGQPLETFLHDQIFAPLGMHGTVLGTHNVRNRAYGYSLENGAWVRRDQSATSATRGDGGIYSSIDDLAKWDASLDGRKLELGWHQAPDKVWHEGETVSFRNLIVKFREERATLIMLTNRDRWCGTLSHQIRHASFHH